MGELAFVNVEGRADDRADEVAGRHAAPECRGPQATDVNAVRYRRHKRIARHGCVAGEDDVGGENTGAHGIAFTVHGVPHAVVWRQRTELRRHGLGMIDIGQKTRQTTAGDQGGAAGGQTVAGYRATADQAGKATFIGDGQKGAGDLLTESTFKGADTVCQGIEAESRQQDILTQVGNGPRTEDDGILASRQSRAVACPQRLCGRFDAGIVR